MPLSTFTRLESIAERSEATPGLFNQRFSILSQNIDQVNVDASLTSMFVRSGSTVTLNPMSLSLVAQSYDSGGARYNIRAFGAVGDNLVDDTAAFVTAFSALSNGGGFLYVPAGRYRITSHLTWTFREGSSIVGAGRGNTILYSSVLGATPAITFSVSATSGRDQRIADFSLYRSDTSNDVPPSRVTGNYGLAALGGIGAGAILENVDIRGFGDSGLRITGPTAPVLICNVNVFFCNGYAMSFESSAGVGTGNVTVLGGAQQLCRGGIFYNGSASQALTVIAADVELGSVGSWPAFHAFNAQGGLTITGGSYSAGETSGSTYSLSPNGIIVLDSCRGATILGAQNLANCAADNLLLQAGGQHVVRGGEWVNRDPGGWLVSIQTNCDLNSFEGMHTSGFQSGRSVINDSNIAANRQNVFGMLANSDETTQVYLGSPVRFQAGSAVLPSLAFTSEASLGWYRSAASAIALSYGMLNLPGPLIATNISGSSLSIAIGGPAFLTPAVGAVGTGSLLLHGLLGQTGNSGYWGVIGYNSATAVDTELAGIRGLSTSASTIQVAEAAAGGALAGNATGLTGDIAWGSSSGVSYLYVCVSANSWMRATLNPF